MFELAFKGFSIFRISSYAYTLVEFARTVGKNLDEVTEEDFRRYVGSLASRNKVSTIREKMKRIRVFMRWLKRLPGNTTPEPMAWFFRIKPRNTKGHKELRVLEKIITEEEYQKLIGVAKSPKMRALLQFMYESGARILEILRVRIKDVDTENHYAVVGGGKRLIALPKTEHIEEWIKKHPMRRKPEAYLFCNSRDPRKPMRYQSVRKILNNLSKKAGLRRRITPHMFRHTRASILAKAGVSPYTMNKVMGWSTDSKMWRTYLHITQKDAVDEVLRKIVDKN